MKDLYIRRAHLDEIIGILSEWQIATKLPNPVLKSILPDRSFIICYKGNKMLVELTSIKKGTVEVHIACPRASLRYSRVLALLGMRWLQTDKSIKAKKLITTAPKGKISNYLLRLGFKTESTETNTYVYDY